jgi:hypothetical protein
VRGGWSSGMEGLLHDLAERGVGASGWFHRFTDSSIEEGSRVLCAELIDEHEGVGEWEILRVRTRIKDWRAKHTRHCW